MMMAETKIEPTLASLSDRLRVLHSQTRETPLFNPVFQLSLDISRKLESGELGIDALAGLVDELEAQSLDARAVRARQSARTAGGRPPARHAGGGRR